MGLVVDRSLLKRYHWSTCNAGRKIALCTARIAMGWYMFAAGQRNVFTYTLRTRKASAPGVLNQRRCDICAGKWCLQSGYASNFHRQASPWKSGYLNPIASLISLSPMLMGDDGQ